MTSELSSLRWLVDHHQTKIQDRIRMIDDLPSLQGAFVVDLGCGPGLWQRLLASKVGSAGRILGIDIDLPLLAFAKANGSGNTSLVRGDFYSIPLSANSVDAVFFSNCFVYTPRVAHVLKEQMRIVRHGGILVGRHFDNTCLIFNPVNPGLMLTVMKAASQALQKRPQENYFDNSFGQKMHGVFISAGLKNVRTFTYAVQITQPLSKAACRYLKGTARWYGDLAAEHLSAPEREAWARCFRKGSSDYILNKKDLFVCMLEMQTVGVVQECEE